MGFDRLVNEVVFQSSNEPHDHVGSLRITLRSSKYVTARQIGRQLDRHTARQTDRQTDR